MCKSTEEKLGSSRTWAQVVNCQENSEPLALLLPKMLNPGLAPPGAWTINFKWVKVGPSFSSPRGADEAV